MSPDLLSLISPGEYRAAWVEAWPSSDELILRGWHLPEGVLLRLSKEQAIVPATEGFRSLSTEQIHIDQLPVEQAADEFSTNKAYPLHRDPQILAQIQALLADDLVDYGNFSPDGQWLVWGRYQSIEYETLYIKGLTAGSSSATLLGTKPYERYHGFVWSPDSSKIAYQVEIGTLAYEIRISDLQGRLVGSIPLIDKASYLAWSPDGRYLAFKMTEAWRSGVNQIYLTGSDGSGLTQLTRHGFAEGPIHWSPASHALIYTYASNNGDSIPQLVTLLP